MLVNVWQGVFVTKYIVGSIDSQMIFDQIILGFLQEFHLKSLNLKYIQNISFVE